MVIYAVLIRAAAAAVAVVSALCGAAARSLRRGGVISAARRAPHEPGGDGVVGELDDGHADHEDVEPVLRRGKEE